MKYLILLSVIALIALSGCVSTTGGILQLKVTDQGNISSLVLSISEVKIHQAVANETGQTEGQETNETDTSGWMTVTGAKTIDLIQVKDIKEILGETTLSEGKYTQVRLSISSATATIDGISYDVKIPSKSIKFIHPFEIETNKTTSLIIDFDADRSLVEAGDKYILKPVVRIETEFEKENKEEAERIRNEQAAEKKAKKGV